MNVVKEAATRIVTIPIDLITKAFNQPKLQDQGASLPNVPGGLHI